MWKDEPYDVKSDIWSLGCVVYEMITLHPPFRAEDMQGLFKKVLRGHYPRIPKQYSTDLSNLVRCLLQVNPKNRPNTEQLLEMPVVTKRMKKLFGTHDSEDYSVLLSTIKVSDNLLFLTDQLPVSTYDQYSPDFSPPKMIHMKTEALEQNRLPSIHNAKGGVADGPGCCLV